ncbi:MAG: YaiI/YqxD family protein [Rhodospirillales bacterium]|nr:YaiI/YqxD family protein [Alphaproteobacteria bacterium]MBL6928518.1 YaiI/YqxD family protein [Rhodospirillales bacterium]
MLEIYVDADACPVKDEVIRVAERHGLKTYLVCDGGIRPSASPLVQLVVVSQGTDAADDWIAEHIGKNDIAITADIPLAARCIEAGARVLRPNGEPITEDTIGMVLATRNLMTDLREAGQITGGPPPFAKKDRSRFLNALETVIQAIGRT